MMRPCADDVPVQVLARTIYGEAAGSCLKLHEAIAAVAVNRFRAGVWGSTMQEVCLLRPDIFRCWDAHSPRILRLLSVDPNDDRLGLCLRVARRTFRGVLADPTRGAVRYHDAGDFPPWARGRAPSAEIGEKLFYALSDLKEAA